MKKKVVGFIAGVVALAAVAGTFAFYSSTNQLDNQLQTKSYGDTLVEKFTPDTDWQPGEEATKEVSVTNTGDYPIVVRIKLNEVWWRDANGNGTIDDNEMIIALDSTQNDGTERQWIFNPEQTNPTDGLTEHDHTVVMKKLAQAGWTLREDGYWYYDKLLAPKGQVGDTSDLFMESITLIDEADLGLTTKVSYYTENEGLSNAEPTAENIGSDPTTKWVVYAGSVPSPSVVGNPVYTRSVSGIDPLRGGYSSALYDLFITSETVQATKDAVDEVWGETASVYLPCYDVLQ